MTESPSLTVIIPALNEERWIGRAVDSVFAQDYPGPLECVVSLGPSTDGTGDVLAELSAREPRLRVVENPAGTTPAALNRAIEAAGGTVIARVDAHGWTAPGYLRAGVEALERTGAAAVGGVVSYAGEGKTGEAIALAMGSRLGAGTAVFRTATSETEADGILWGFWRRADLREWGGFDEDLLRNQDDELCHRIRSRGGRIVVTPAARFTHVARSSLEGLARQYWQWGRFRAKTVRKHRRPATVRQMVPPAIALGVSVPSLAFVLTGGRARVAGAVPAAYAAGVFGAGVLITRERADAGLALRAAGAVASMQLAYGWGFLTAWLAGETASGTAQDR